jgi:hypothetical protein
MARKGLQIFETRPSFIEEKAAWEKIAGGFLFLHFYPSMFLHPNHIASFIFSIQLPNLPLQK